jgi:hypothetical protein
LIENSAVAEAHDEQEDKAAPVHHLVKWNPREESPGKWLASAAEHGDWGAPRPGKRVALCDGRETRTHDVDIERPPSGKFAATAPILACAGLAYSIPHRIGRNGLLGPDAPPRQRAKRRRIRTLMQEPMYRTARPIHAGRGLKPALGYACPVVPILRRPDARLACA